jgi:hypothetical protein
MRASVIVIAATGLAVSVGPAGPAQAMTARPAGLLAAMPGLDKTDKVDCRRVPHAHRHGHRLDRGCGIVRRDRDVIVRGTRTREFDTTPLLTIQKGTQPLGSGESGRVESLRSGPGSNTPSGVPPLTGRSSTGSSTGSTAPLSSSPSGSSGGSSTSGSSSSGSSGGSN